MNNKVYAVFVNTNSGDSIVRAVKAVLKFKLVVGAIITDNGSTDGGIEKVAQIKAKGKKVVIIQNGKNLGFDVSINKSIKKALSLGADYIIPLDSDLDYSWDFVQRLYDAGGDYTVPVLKFKRNGNWVYDYGGRVNWLIGRTTHLERDKPLDPKKAAISANDRTTENWFDFVSGGCTLVKRVVFEKIGFYDEDYFLYYGDTEISLRARKAGFKVVVDPTTFMWHTLKEHKVTVNKFKLKTVLEGNLTFINKCIAWYFKPFAYTYFVLLVAKVWYNTYLKSYVESIGSYRQLSK